jgi:hypothetical protein
VLIITLLVQGVISMPMALIALLLIAIGLALGGIARFIVRVGIPLLSLLIVSITFGGGNIKNITGILSNFVTLIIILVAFYIMFLPFRRR